MKESIYNISNRNRAETVDLFNKHKGQFVIINSCGCRVERFIAIGVDKYDYLYITFDGVQLHSYTILEHFVPLKGFIGNNDYNNIVRGFIPNHSESFCGEALKSVDNYINAQGITLLSEVCLELSEA